MLNMPAEFEQFHWMVDMVQNVDMGLVVIDRDYNVQVWNGFMTHHSGLQSHDAIGRSIFDIFPEIPQEWFKLKTKPVYDLAVAASSHGDNDLTYSAVAMFDQLRSKRSLCTRMLR